MLTYCLNEKKTKKTKTQKMWVQNLKKLKIVDQIYHQNVLNVAVKNHDFWKYKEQKEY